MFARRRLRPSLPETPARKRKVLRLFIRDSGRRSPRFPSRIAPFCPCRTASWTKADGARESGAASPPAPPGTSRLARYGSTSVSGSRVGPRRSARQPPYFARPQSRFRLRQQLRSAGLPLFARSSRSALPAAMRLPTRRAWTSPALIPVEEISPDLTGAPDGRLPCERPAERRRMRRSCMIRAGSRPPVLRKNVPVLPRKAFCTGKKEICEAVRGAPPGDFERLPGCRGRAGASLRGTGKARRT